MDDGAVPVKWVCCACGSDKVRATAQVRWDIAKQDWVLVPNTLSEPIEDYCEDCGCNKETEEVGLDVRDMAYIAIERNKETN
jgi:hypothetical protein